MKLSEVKEWKILLLEAGGEEPHVSYIPAFGNNLKLTPLDWQFWTEPQKNSCGGKPCQWPRGKVLGGGSAINDMIYNRGNKYDYEGWAKLGNVGWDYANVLPYFKKSEHNLDEDIRTNQIHHSIGGYQAIGRFPHIDSNMKLIIKGLTDLGLKVVDFNGAQVLGAAHLQATQIGGERRSTNRAFLDPIRKYRKNLKIVTNVRVIKVLIKPGTKTAYGIEYIGEKNRAIAGKIYAKKDIILSAGSINSPHILMLSGIGPKETLEKLNIPVIKNLRVGYNLQDHVGASAVNFIVGNSTRPSKKDIIRDGFLYSSIPREGSWSGIGSLSVTSYFNTKYADTSIDFPDVQFSTIPSLANVKDQDCDLDFDIPWCYYNRVTFMPSVLRPKSKGIGLTEDDDPNQSFTEGHEELQVKGYDIENDDDVLDDNEEMQLRKNDMEINEDENENNWHTRKKRSVQPEHRNEKKVRKLGGRKGKFEEGEKIEKKEKGMGRKKNESEKEGEENELRKQDENDGEREGNNPKWRTKRSIQNKYRSKWKLMKSMELGERKDKEDESDEEDDDEEYDRKEDEKRNENDDD
ncbi:hypothetical protein C0J52_11848 [Blattella germanica]|nr:hypothetical protein C0J52_11848 [Blattella germanica]